ncbi:HDOD domain-containing protein [Nitrincola sp. MINF-07-Sa-05]|uniref:HDOD domain-containing protein n=1 Tax=Nitrincola salilacus TaxID=3400273 RepID=UPI0039185EDE
MSVGVKPLDPSEQSVARLVLLHDSAGKVLVILPAHSLLSLSVVWRLTGRQLQPTSAVDAAKFFGQTPLTTAAGQRQLLKMTVMLDDHYLPDQEVALWEPHSGLRFTIQAGWLEGADYQTSLGLSGEVLQAQHSPHAGVEAITHAVERFTALRVKQRLEDTLGLPAFSQTTQKLLLLRSDPSADVDRLLSVIRVDPSLSAQVMSWAVSPYYAAPGRIESVDDAVIRVLGFDLVVNLALGVAMGKVMQVPGHSVRGATPFWLQSVTMATLAERLAKVMPAAIRPKPGLVYLSGLLNNFGYLLLAHLFPPQFSTLTRYIEANPHMPYELVEQQVLNLTREQVGAWLLESWSIPPEVCFAVRYQNHPEIEGDAVIYARLLHVANCLLRQQGLCDGPLVELDPQLLEQLQLKPSVVEGCINDLIANQDGIRELTELLQRH